MHRSGCVEPIVANNRFIKKIKWYFVDEGGDIISFVVRSLPQSTYVFVVIK